VDVALDRERDVVDEVGTPVEGVHRRQCRRRCANDR
jgi:hypothetical protein